MSPLLSPFTDRVGRLAPLKCAAFAAAVAPALWLAVAALDQRLGSRPVTEAIHQSGLWAVRLLAATLAVTPLRVAMRWSKLVAIRRILGVAVLAYAVLHVFLYAFDQHFAALHIASEIARRVYLAIGFSAFLLLCALGATSTDRMIARLGARRWARLHKSVYAVALLASAHFFMQSKLDVTQPTIMAGIFALLLGFRAATRAFGDLATGAVAALAVLFAGSTALAEAVWFAISAHAPVAMVLAANLDFSYTVRPAWYVLGAALVLTLARAARPLFAPPRRAIERRAFRPAMPG